MWGMVSFVASFAAAGALTAAAVIVSPESQFWRWLLWGSSGVLTACAAVSLLHLFKPDGDWRYLVGIGVGVALTAACGFAFYLNQKPEAELRRPFQTFANADLRANVSIFGDALRNMESKYQSLMAPPLIDPLKLPIITDEQKANSAHEFVEWQKQYQKLADQEREEFEAHYRRKAIDLKDELWIRLGVKDYGTPQNDLLGNSVRGAFDVGLLAGVRPLSNLATYLEGLASKLK
jgi:hypothetical protein